MNRIVTLDIHGMTVSEAQRYIILSLNRLNDEVEEVVIIHGYIRGTALSNMVRKNLKHPRIKNKILSLNHGQTSLILK